MNKLQKLTADYNSIDTMKDLQKRRLTLNDYDTLYYIIKNLVTAGKSVFYEKTILHYLSGLGIECKQDGIGWIAVL